MYELTVSDDFSAAHRLPRSGGKCDRLHGHNWKVEARIGADELNDKGMVFDFHDLRDLVRSVLEDLDHTYLNEHPAFEHNDPTAENLARHIYESLAARLAAYPIRLRQVRVWESETTAATYLGERREP